MKGLLPQAIIAIIVGVAFCSNSDQPLFDFIFDGEIHAQLFQKDSTLFGVPLDKAINSLMDVLTYVKINYNPTLSTYGNGHHSHHGCEDDVIYDCLCLPRNKNKTCPDCGVCAPGYVSVKSQRSYGCPICKCEILGCDEENIQANILRNKSVAPTCMKDGIGCATLAFVFDTTNSMIADLIQVKDAAGEILDATLESPDTPIHDFLLVEFNDPTVGPLTETTDKIVFQTALDNILVSGGGDCPEMALGGIIMALEVVLPNSFVYVFTDASAKDKEKLNQVLDLIQEKQAQVTILLTGDNCKENLTTYETIASSSSGQVFEIEKDDLMQILYYVSESVGEEKVNLVSVEYDAGITEFEVLVDNTMKILTVSVSGTNINIQIYGPDGDEIDVRVIVDIVNVKIVGVDDPTPGRCTIIVSSDTKYTIRATGDSSISFDTGFSLMPTVNFTGTSRRPIEGVTSYILVKPKERSCFGDIYRIQLINLNGTILHDSSLKLIPGYIDKYNGTSFIAPGEMFHIKIFGCDLTGSEFERISASAISAQPPSMI